MAVTFLKRAFKKSEYGERWHPGKVLYRSDVTDMHDSGQSITRKRVTDSLVARFCSQSHSASSVSA